MDHTPLLLEMTAFDEGSAQRIQHFLKVYELCRTIGLCEKLDARTQNTLEAAALVHDIGIRPSLSVYGDDAGPHQEELGPAEAQKMLGRLGYDPEMIFRVCWLVGHHHTYDPVDGIDHQILIEADFLVNLFENSRPAETVRSVYERIFRTETGRLLCRRMFADAF